LQSGQVVSLAAPRHGQPADQVRILEEREGLAAAYKPAGISTEPDRRGTESLCSRASALLGLLPADVHALSRLDYGVSGVVLLATTAAGRRHATLAREQGHIVRRYVGIAASAPAEQRGIWQRPVDERPASTRYACMESAPGRALLAFEPGTGRMHQLRVHAAGAGAPLLGDHTYGGPRRSVLADGSVIEFARVALHAARVTLPDLAHDTWRVSAPVADDMLALWQQLGGSDEAWERALSEELGE
jgi:23S rRNA-/tRNA-specific pseudouridylate synthase